MFGTPRVVELLGGEADPQAVIDRLVLALDGSAAPKWSRRTTSRWCIAPRRRRDGGPATGVLAGRADRQRRLETNREAMRHVAQAAASLAITRPARASEHRRRRGDG